MISDGNDLFDKRDELKSKNCPKYVRTVSNLLIFNTKSRGDRTTNAF